MYSNYFNTPILRAIFGITAIPLFFLLTGCRNFYKATAANAGNLEQNLNNGNYARRYFILRDGPDSYAMNSVSISDDRATLTCRLDTLPAEHSLHLTNGRNGKMRYKKTADEAAVVNEVHLYIAHDSSAKAGNTYTLPLAGVQKIEVLEKDKGRTTASYILGGLGYTIGALAVVGVIAMATKSSCPFVSAYNEGSMQLQGEIYGGAIYPQLCRNDYIPLHMQPTPAAKLQLQISNELKEKQFTDLAELLVITHNKQLKVLPDEQGNLHTVSKPVSPVTASSEQHNVLPLVQHAEDDLLFSFNDTAAAKSNNNKLLLGFEKPSGAQQCKLVLRLKNSYWLDMVYGKFTEGFGNTYTSFIRQQYAAPVARLNKWKIDQQIPLTIDVLTTAGWQTQQTLTTFGPLAVREMAIPINISDISDHRISIALSTGFMFWEIDYAALDFSPDSPLEVTRLLPEKAKDETGIDIRALLSREDGNFLSQPRPGNAAVIEYAFKPVIDTAKMQTYILHAKGYYEHVRDYTNDINLDFLQRFRQPGALGALSLSLYRQTIHADLNALVQQ